MKSVFVFLLVTFSCLSFGQKPTQSIGFIENKGQIVDQKGKPNTAVKYLLNTNGLNVQLRANGFSYDVYETKKVALTHKEQASVSNSSSFNRQNIPDHKLEYTVHRIDIDFVNSNAGVELVAEGKSTDFDNYYSIASRPDGVTNIFKFQKVTYRDIYPNIDIVFFIPEDSSKPVEYNFVVKPEGKISDIQMKFSGAKTELIDNKIKMAVRFGAMEETLPMSWSAHDKKAVSINYRKLAKNLYGLVSEENIQDKKIIIDPVPIRLWGTYYGGSGTDYDSDIITNANNDVYLCGNTQSPNNIATSGTHLSVLSGGANLFFVKFDSNGNRLWGTYFLIDNGNFNSHLAKMATDSQNNLYFVSGELYNSNIATSGAFQTVKANYNDVILAKLNDSGIRLWATYYGGNDNEYPEAVCVDSSDNVYISGESSSSDALFTAGAHQVVNHSQSGFQDAYLAKFDSNGNRLWATFYGGIKSESFMNLAISDDGFLYATGTSNSSTDIATPGAYQPTDTSVNGLAGMIVKFDLSGQRIWGTYVGNDCYMFYAKLKGDNIYFAGTTFATAGLSTPGTFSQTYQSAAPNSNLYGLENAYVMSFNVRTQQKNWGTYFPERINSIGVNQSEEVYFSGDTRLASGIATADGYMSSINLNANKCYLVKLDHSGQRLWGTYYGGNLGENLGRMCLDRNSDIYLMGFTGSTSGIATAGAHQTSIGSVSDSFIVKFRDCFSVTVANSNSPTCIGSTLNLTASGGTGYAWTGPNGFTSSQQNPNINNVTTANSGLYSCAITGSGSCDNTVSINVVVGDTVKPVPDVTTLPTINGDCNTIASIPTATDNCAGAVSGTTTDPLNYPLPGNYTIHWNYTDGNGNIETQTQSVVISAVALPTVVSPQKFCVQRNATINNISITGANVKWYDALTGGNLLASTTVLQDGITYYASQTLTSCESARVPVLIAIQNTFAPTGISPQTFCAAQNPTLGNLITMGTSNWYSSATSTISLPFSTPLVDGATYYATQTVDGCESVSRLAITVGLISTLNAINYAATHCDNGNDGSESVNLSMYDADLISVSGNIFSYYNSATGAENQIAAEEFTTTHTIVLGANTIYVRIDSANGCHQVVTLELTLVSVPVITLPDEVTLCERRSVTITAAAGFNLYVWSTNVSTQSITVSQPGNYWLMVGLNNGQASCTTTKNFTVVLSNEPTISSVAIVDWTDTDNSITVNLSSGSIGDYEYSIDGVTFQSSNVFTGLQNGAYTVTVKDKKGCGIDTEEVYLLNYPKFFTPNSDGHNDGWSIKFSQLEPNFEVRIFDRYGKLLRIMSNREAWDGIYEGKLLPADDYWFYITRNDGRIHKGHFSLIR